MSMIYVAPDDHRDRHSCTRPRNAFGRPPFPAGSVWRCTDCDTAWVVTLTKDWPPRRVWTRVRWWHFDARRRLREADRG